MPPILVYEQNRPYIIEQFHHGHFDYIDVVQEVAQRDSSVESAGQTHQKIQQSEDF